MVTVTGPPLAAEDVVASAMNCLAKSVYRALRGVVCQYDRGAIILRGRLSSYYEKQLAQESVRGLQGVERIVNEIEVSDHSNHRHA